MTPHRKCEILKAIVSELVMEQFCINPEGVLERLLVCFSKLDGITTAELREVLSPIVAEQAYTFKKKIKDVRGL